MRLPLDIPVAGGPQGWVAHELRDAVRTKEYRQLADLDGQLQEPVRSRGDASERFEEADILRQRLDAVVVDGERFEL